MKKRIYCITMALCIILCIVFAAGCSKAANSSAALPELRNNGTAVQWKYSDETDWRDLVALTELTGAAGENGKDGDNGTNGKDGINGTDGKNGINGTDGKNGINGTDGKNGIDGKNGKDGTNGKDGINGKNIEVKRTTEYIQWRYEGGEWQNLVSIPDITGPAGQNGADGANGKTPEFRVNENTLQWRYAGDEIWLNLYDLTALKGADGRDGADGKNGKDGTNGQNGSDGEDGKTPFIGENGNWWIGEIDTGVKAAGTVGEKGDKGDKGEKGDKGDKGDAGQNGGCAGYFHASNGGTGASFNQPLQLFEDCNSGGLFVWDRTNRTVTLKAGHTYSLSFSGSVCISHDMGGWYSVVLKGKQGILKDTLIERYMNDADNSRVWMPFAFNRIYSAGSDIVLQYEFIQLTPGTQLNGAVYNLTIIALD